MKIKLIPEVWSLIFSFLSYDDLIGASAVCKCFYYLSQNNDGFVKKLSDLRALFSGVSVYEYCWDACLRFAGQLSHGPSDNFEEEVFLEAKEIIMTELVFGISQFRVRNHLFFCSRSHYCSDICLFCTRVNISHHGVSGYINKKLFVPITYFPQSIREGIVLMEKVYFFVHYHGAFAKVNIHASYVSNFGVLHYECINSPFILY